MSGPAVELQFKGKDSDLSSTFDRVSSKSRQLSDDVDVSARKIGDSSEQHSGRAKAAFGGMATGIAGFFAGMVASSGGDMMQMGANLQALDAKAKIVFQDQLPRVQKWAEANRKAFGDSSRNVVAMAANMTDLLKPMGFTAAKASDISLNLLDLSGALSRWSGGTRSAAEVSEILSDALLGETDSLKGLGISLSASEIQSKAVAMGFGEMDKKGKLVTDSIDQQETALATMQLIQEKSTDAQKAWADGGKEAAEKQNAAASDMKESMEKLAISLQPLIELLTRIFSGFMEFAANHTIVVGALAAVAVAVWAVNSAMLANPITWIILLIGGLVAGFIWLWQNVEGFRNFWIGVWHAITDSVSNAISWVKTVFNELVAFFTNNPIGKVLAAGFQGAIAAINAVASAIKWLIDRARDAIGWIQSLLDKASMITGAKGVPQIQKGSGTTNIPKHHDGIMTVPGATGEEVLAILQAGERVTPRSQVNSSSGGGGAFSMRITGDGGLFEMVQYALRTGAIQLVNEDTGARVVVA